MTAIQTQDGSVIKEFKYRFKKTDFGQRASVSISAPVISLAQIAQIAMSTEKNSEGVEVPSKQAELLQEAVYAIYQDQIREFVNGDEKISQDSFPFDKVTWDAIATMDRTSRRGAGITKDTWEAFSKDYCAVMPAITGKSAEAVAQAANIFVRKFRDVTGNLKVVEKLRTYLAMYVEAPGSKAEEFEDVIEFLVKKASDMLEAQDKEVSLANL